MNNLNKGGAEKMRLRWKDGFKDGIPIALGYISVAVAFGILAADNGLPLWSPLLMSFAVFTGTGQFAGVHLISSHAGLTEVAFSLLVINIRSILMSISLAQKLPKEMSIPRRMAVAFGNTDEVFGVCIQKREPLTFSYLIGIILISYLGWNFGTALGVLSSAALPLPIRSAMGIALYAMFIAIILPPVRDSKPLAIVVAISGLVSVLFRVVPYLATVGSGWKITICGILAAGVCAALFPEVPAKTDKDDKDESGTRGACHE